MLILIVSKVFTFTKGYDFGILVSVTKIIRGGTGYGGKVTLSIEAGCCYPDYSLYFDKILEVQSIAYGFLARGY